MLSIGAMGGGQGDYYINLATEDYYLQGGEPPGQWLGAGAEALGLKGTVEREAFAHLLSGFSADGKAALIQNAGADNHQPGWDLTFSAPKSVSVLWSQADDATRRILQDAHFEAVQAALAFIQDEAGVTRRGKGGAEREEARLVIASFEHGTSRAQDPQLHTHALVLNVGVRTDGTQGTIESKPLYQAKMTAGALYRAELSKLLEQRLGLESYRQKSCFEVKGAPDSLLKEFSKRREEILERMEAKGVQSAKAAAIAALDTRAVKGHISRHDLFALWREVGREHGFSQDALNALWQKHRPDRDVEGVKKEVLSESMGQVMRQNSHFSGRDLLRATAEAAQGQGLGAREVRGAVKEHLAHSPEIVRLGKMAGQERYTTREMLELEKTMLARADASKTSAGHTVSANILTAVLEARPTITDEQKAALLHITQRPGSLQVVSGMAGTGKTFLLDAAREAWEKAGYSVLGAALAGKAADGLKEGAKIESDTIHKTLMNIDSGVLKITPKTILVIDEAGMVGTRQMERLLREVEAGRGKLILVGDARQLQPIEAGGAFKAIAERLGQAELTTIIRQRDEWAREAVRYLSEGNAQSAMIAFAAKGLVTIADDRNSAMRDLIACWKKEGISQASENLIFTGTNLEAVTLNRMAQEERRLAGALGEARARVGGEYFYEGDRVLFTKNSKYYDVKNGNLGTVLGMDKIHHALQVKLDNGKRVTIGLTRYGEDHVKLGYAVTTHKGQGATVENAYVLMGGSMQDREISYVQASRARGETRIYADKAEAGEHLQDLIHDMSASRQKTLALEIAQEIQQVKPRH